jgi:hypothetical protein
MYMRGSEPRTDRSNPDVAIIIPSTGRAKQCARLVERIHHTARLRPRIIVSVEPDDVKPYARALTDLAVARPAEPGLCGLIWDQTGTAGPGSHVAAINRAARCALAERFIDETEPDPKLIIKLDDDHWPITPGWDQLYLNALDELGGTGVVYGNDLFQRDRLPTVPGISTDIVRELGWYAPPTLGHWFCDNFWLELGQRAGRLKYLPDVIIEHRNVQAGKAPHDATYQAGGLNAARITADERVWREMTRPTEAGGGRLDQPAPKVHAWPSQMDVWAGKVAGLAGRKGWRP